MKHNLPIIAFSLLAVTISNAQTTELHVGTEANSLVVSSGETFHVSGITFNPTTALNLTNTQLIKATTVRNTVDRTYFPLVFRFGSTYNNNNNRYSGTIRIDYGATNPTPTNESSLKFHYHDGSSWVPDVSSSVNTTDNFVLSSTLSSVNLDEMVIAEGTTILPVTWLDFTAQRQANQVLLQWSTASEINTQDFVVQHSLNAADWASLGSIDAAGNSNVTNRYSYIHTSPVKGSNTINYYRILQRDLDGKFSFSKILSLRFEDGREEVLVYPNPAVHTLTMYLPTTQHVRLVNQQGALIWQGQMQAGRNQLQVSHLAKGMYYLLTDDGSHPVVIQ